MRRLFLTLVLVLFLIPVEASAYGYGYHGYEVLDEGEEVWLGMILHVSGVTYSNEYASTAKWTLTGIRFGLYMTMGDVNVTVYQTTLESEGHNAIHERPIGLNLTEIIKTRTTVDMTIHKSAFNIMGHISRPENNTVPAFFFKMTALENSVFEPFYDTYWAPIFEYSDYYTTTTPETTTTTTTHSDPPSDVTPLDFGEGFGPGILTGIGLMMIPLLFLILDRRRSG